MRYAVLLIFAVMLTSYVSLTAPSAQAQEEDTGALLNRIDRLERDVNFLQKQVYRGASADSATPGAPITNGGQIEVRLTQINEELRQLHGAVEQTQFANRQTAADLKKLSDDVEYRLHALEEKQTVASPAPLAAATPAEAAAAAEAAAPPAAAHFDPAKKPEDAKKQAVTGNDFPDANAHYSYAFKLLNDKKYSEAATNFDAFVKKYPSDPLTANAYYWLGESYYARADYTRSAESFRKGFEANPAGQKAPDNLYKLAKSLAQVKRNNEACIVLAQIISKYPDDAPRIVKLAQDERVTMQCK